MSRLIALLVLLAAGCTPLEWTRPGASPDELRQDVAYCRQEAWREAQWNSFLFLNRYYGATTVVDAQGRRIVVPNSPFGNPFGDRYIDEARLAHFCMRAKGYELVPIESAKGP
jgi:hypothetical protein